MLYEVITFDYDNEQLNNLADSNSDYDMDNNGDDDKEEEEEEEEEEEA